MSIFDAIIQGIIQGLTEFLPVSSSGHLSISKHIFGIEMPGILFDIMLHLGTLIAVVFVYRQLIWRLIKEFGSLCVDIAHRNFKWSEMNHDRRLLFMLVIGLLPLFFLFVPIPGTGLDFKGLSDMLGSDSDILVEGLALLATSALLFAGIAANKRVNTRWTLSSLASPSAWPPSSRGCPVLAPPFPWACCGASTSRPLWTIPLCWASPPSPRRPWCLFWIWATRRTP